MSAPYRAGPTLLLIAVFLFVWTVLITECFGPPRSQYYSDDYSCNPYEC